MKKTDNTPKITINTNIENRTTVQIDDVVLDREALMLLDGLQEDLGEHYRNMLRRVSDVLIENCEDMNIEYDEMMRLLQVLGQLRADILTLIVPRDPQTHKSGFDMLLERHDRSEDNAEVIASLELAEANDNPANDGNDDNPEGDDDDSEMQYAGK